jgi:hypothetical protein
MVFKVKLVENRGFNRLTNILTIVKFETITTNKVRSYFKRNYEFNHVVNILILLLNKLCPRHIIFN